MRKQALSLIVENTSSVLSHVSGLFSRRGYNIDSISAGVTADPRYTRITIVSSGDRLILEQIENQLAKLEDVLDIKRLEAGSSVTRELILVKLRVQESSRQEILSVIEIFRGKVVDVTRDSMVIELTGNQDKLSAFLDLVSGCLMQSRFHEMHCQKNVFKYGCRESRGEWKNPFCAVFCRTSSD